MNNNITEGGCIYCRGGVALALEEVDDEPLLEYCIAVRFPDKLSIYGRSIRLGNGINLKIKYCPMCGYELKK